MYKIRVFGTIAATQERGAGQDFEQGTRVESSTAHSMTEGTQVLAVSAIGRKAGVRSVLRAAFDEARAAHVGIDIQHKYCASAYGDDPAERANVRRIAARIADFTAATRAVMAPVWVNHVNDNDADWRTVPGQDKGWRALGVRISKIMGINPYGEEGFARRDIYGTHAQPGDVVLAKPRFDGFEDTRLDDVLRARAADTLVLTGLFMDQCVMETALTARRKGYEVVVAANLSAVGDVMKTGEALRKLRDGGVMVATAGAVITEARPWR